MRKPLAYFFSAALFLLCGCSLVTDGENYTDPHNPRYCSINNTVEHQTPDIIKVVSYNIKFAKRADLAADLLKSHKDLCQADIIFLQEMDREGVQMIAQKLNYNYIYYPAVSHPLTNKDFGNAIITKWPIVFDQKIILPHLDPDDLQRVAVGAGIKIGQRYIMAYSIHMSIWLQPYQRKEQLAALFTSMPLNFDAYIVGGDFNTFTKFNRKNIFDAVNAAGFELATPSIKWSYKHWYLLYKKSLVDYIFVKNMESVGAGIVKNRRASDHVPIWTEVKFGEYTSVRK